MRTLRPATAYASGVSLAAAWDPERAARVGRSMGRDATARGVAFLLAPGVNIIPGHKRSRKVRSRSCVLLGCPKTARTEALFTRTAPILGGRGISRGNNLGEAAMRNRCDYSGSEPAFRCGRSPTVAYLWYWAQVELGSGYSSCNSRSVVPCHKLPKDIARCNILCRQKELE